MAYRAVFRCISGCEGEHPLDVPLYRCPSCGGLLEVVHDLAALAATPASQWKATFESRDRRLSSQHPSAVWTRREWVCPAVRDESIVSMGEGGAPMLPLPRYGAAIGLDDVWVKHCGLSPTGSFKDLGMTVLVSMVRQMIAGGRHVRAVACASTGDTSAALSAYAAAAGIPAIVILPRGKISTAQLLQPLANGAHVLALDTDFDGCMAIVQRLAVEAGVYLANSMNSLRLEGQKTVAFDIAQQFGWQAPDAIVIPGGNLGNVSALAAGFDMLGALGLVSTRPRIVVAQAEAANPLYLASKRDWQYAPVKARPTQATAIQIGNPVSVAKAVRALQRYDGLVEQATEAELSDAAAQADRAGLFACPHTGVALAVAEKLARRGVFERRDRVVVISTASGLKFAEFKHQYHAAPAWQSPLSNQPVNLPDDYDEVRRAIDRLSVTMA